MAGAIAKIQTTTQPVLTDNQPGTTTSSMLKLVSLSLPTVDELADQDFSKVVLATLLWCYLLNCFGAYQALSNPDVTDAKVRLDYSNKAWATADRTFLNLGEQTPIFLAYLWMHAIFCGADMAGTLGLICVAARAAYPVLRSIKFLLMEFSTLTYYMCVNAMKINLYSKLIYGEAVSADTMSTKLLLFAFGYYLSAIPIGFALKFVCAAALAENEKSDEEEAAAKKKN